MLLLLLMNLRSFPPVIHSPRRIICIGDLHGDREIFIGILLTAKCIKISKRGAITWIGKDTHVVCMGDTTDSLRAGIKAPESFLNKPMERELQYDIPYIDSIAKFHGGAVLSILGNHDIWASENDDYVKLADKASYTDRPKFYAPGGEGAKMFAITRNVIQIIGPFLFVHGSLVPEFFLGMPGPAVSKIRCINSSMKSYLMKKSQLPIWYTKSRLYEVNPIESRRYAWESRRKHAVTSQADTVLDEIPGVHTMVLGHTIVPKVAKKGNVICTDVALSRAFGDKTDIILQYLEIDSKHIPHRVTLYMNGKVTRKKI